MRFANPKAAAAYAAQSANPKPRPSTGGVKQAVIPGRGIPRGGMGKPTFMSDQLRGAPQSKQMQFMSDQLRGGASGSPRSGTLGGVGPRPAGGAMPAGSAEYAKAALASTQKNSGTPKSGTGPKPGFGAAVKQLGLGPGMKSGGSVGSASKRADGIAVKGKTKGKMMSKGGKTC